MIKLSKNNTIKTQKINIEELKPAEYNPRVMPPSEQLKLKNGLETFGLVDPIIIDLTDNNTVIGGHQRLEVLKEINDEQELTVIPLGDIGLVIRETDLKIKDKNDQKALNLALNKIQGDWDYSKLDDLLLELSEDHYQIELTGFDEEDMILDNSFELENSIEDEIENELNKGVTEWDKELEYQEDMIQNDKPTKSTIWFEPGDKIKLGNHILIMGEKNDNYFSIKLMDEAIIQFETGIKDAFIKDNKEIYDRMNQIQYENRLKRENL